MEKLKFPKNFWWGSATSGPQTEGNDNVLDMNKSESIWERQYKEDKYRFFDLEPTKNNLVKNFKADIKLAKDLNFNSLRTSIQWSRLMPNGKDVNKQAISFYREMFQEMIDSGIEPFINLFHFDMPMWAQNIGGWTSREVVDKFVIYAKTAFELFGDIVKKWFTSNEPIVVVEGQYLYDFHYPNELSFEKSTKAIWHNIMAHHLCVREFRKQDIKNGTIGSILNITPAIPRSQAKADLKAAKIAELFQWKCFADPFMKGEKPNELISLLESKKLWPKNLILKGDEEIIKNNIMDIIGLNFYSPLRVKALDYIPNFNVDTITPNTHFFNTYQMPGRRMNIYRGWEIYPKALYMMLKTIKDEYNNFPCYISENGMGVEDEQRFKDKKGMINDSYRIEFINEHLYWVHKAIKEGSSCKGYHMWTYIDNWSWNNAYKNRYGFYSLDIKTGKRTPKKSSQWIKKVIEENAIEIDIKLLIE